MPVIIFTVEIVLSGIYTILHVMINKLMVHMFVYILEIKVSISRFHLKKKFYIYISILYRMIIYLTYYNIYQYIL